ncbi:MAG: heavy-metal-associated protein, partial [Sediminibacterium sp.]|nr:heavy-metal-associated protein [Sediminibacterium sp.]
SGLTCAMCSKAVYKALSDVPFVDKVKADIEHSSYDITFKPDGKVDFDALSKAVVNAGFSVSMLKVTTNFKDVKVQNDAHVSTSDQSFHFLNVTPQTLTGTKTVTLVDKNFVSTKDYKKYSKLTSMQCYESGTMNGQRIYHVTM